MKNRKWQVVATCKISITKQVLGDFIPILLKISLSGTTAHVANYSYMIV